MTPKEKAKELYKKFYIAIPSDEMGLCENAAKKCALIAVDHIISSNPHSNPFNTTGYSTMGHWWEVKKEIELL